MWTWPINLAALSVKLREAEKGEMSKVTGAGRERLGQVLMGKHMWIQLSK